LKLFKSNFFWLIYTISLSIYSFTLFFQWGLMIVTLFGIFWLFRLTRWEANLLPKQQYYYWWMVATYPLLEMAVLLWKRAGNLAQDFDWVNRLEHGYWATALAFFFLPMIAEIWKRLNPWQNLLVIASFVCLLGNLNEFLEYLLRLPATLENQARFAAYYSDTIYDMGMNLLGGLVSFGLLSLILGHGEVREVKR
jgi:hypothetical protein